MEKLTKNTVSRNSIQRLTRVREINTEIVGKDNDLKLSV